MSAVEVMTDELWDDLVGHKLPFENYLFLEPHPTLQRQWKVEGDDPSFTARLDGALSRFGAVSVWGYDDFADASKAAGYTPVFMRDPSDVFDWKASLSNAPGVAVESRLDGRLDRNGTPLRLINGFLPFQAVGVNFQAHCDRCVYYNWSTGSGKTLAAEGTILWRREKGYGPNKDEGFDLCLYVVTPNNLYNTRRKLKEHTGLDARILSGTPKRRERLFAETAAKMQNGEQPILVFNAEKFREDTEYFKLLVEDNRVLVIFDEMPEKYANRGTQLYRATSEVLYTSSTVVTQGKSKGQRIFYPMAGKDRPSEVFYVALCATPIRNSPEDVFNCVRIMDSTVYGSTTNFNNLFVAKRDRWGNVVAWKNLDLFAAMCAHIVHQADKVNDPEIAAQFPVKLPHEIDYCDMDAATEKLYGALQSEYEDIGNASILDFDEILAAITVMQMLCNNPRAVLDSAIAREKFEIAFEAYKQEVASKRAALKKVGITMFLAKTMVKAFEKRYKEGSEVALKLREKINNDAKFTDQDAKGNCIISKMLKLKDRIEQHDDKVIVFSAENESLQPYIAEWFDKWGIAFVAYNGTMTAKQKQEAQDKFRTDPSVKVFLGTDAGKSAIDLPEASLTIHYDEPWTAATKEQRGNRQDRIDSIKTAVQEITLRVPFTVDDRKAEVIAIKQGYHDKVFGSGEIAEQAEELRKSDFLYILTGQRD